MSGWSKMVDLEMSDDRQLESVYPIPMPETPRYPCGLRICLTHDELEKLGLDDSCDIGDMIDIRAFAEVTSVSKTELNGEKSCRVELQLIRMQVESEADESPDDEGKE